MFLVIHRTYSEWMSVILFHMSTDVSWCFSSAASHPSPVPPGFESDTEHLPLSRCRSSAAAAADTVDAKISCSSPTSLRGVTIDDSEEAVTSVNGLCSDHGGRFPFSDALVVEDYGGHRDVNEVGDLNDDIAADISQEPNVESSLLAKIPRRRAVDLSDLRHCAIVQTQLKSGVASAWKTYGFVCYCSFC